MHRNGVSSVLNPVIISISLRFKHFTDMVQSTMRIMLSKTCHKSLVKVAVSSMRLHCVPRQNSMLCTCLRAACLQGITALHIAAYKGFIEIVELLLLKGAHVDVKDKFVSGPTIALYPSTAQAVSTIACHRAELVCL